MKTKPQLLLAVLLLLGSTALAQTATWSKITDIASGFTIEAPAGLERSQFTSPGGKLIDQFYLSVGGMEFAVLVNEQKLSDTSTAELRRRYDNARDGSVNSLKGAKLSSERDVSLGGVLGRESVITNSEYYATTRFFLFGDRFYQVMVLAPPAKAADPAYQKATARFLDSFRFISGGGNKP